MRRNYFNKPIRKRFIDAFPKFERDQDEPSDVKYFWETWLASPFFDPTLTQVDLSNVYHHLLATFYDWHYIYGDDFGIALNTMHLIHDYYPNAKERLNIVSQIRNLSLEEFKKSGLNINSQGANPKVNTDMDELIDLVDSQTASFQLKSEEQALRAKFNSLYDGVMEEFVDRFKPLFVRLYNGVTDYIYTNEIGEEEEEE